ncbi:MAG TPA: hypothetical protein VK986_13965 [Tepidisphaeraceae bacterium]|nr:hypothetical protein [Tepidisphaeraceae bacterium]
MMDQLHSSTAAAPGMLAIHWPLQLEYWHWGYGVAFAVAAAVTVWMGMASLAGLGPVRKWVAIGVRVGVLGLLFLIVCGARWARKHEAMEVMIVRDISQSADNFQGYTLATFEDSWRDYLKSVNGNRDFKQKDDEIGEIVFGESAVLQSMLSKELVTDAAPIKERRIKEQTDVASALELALASFRPGAMHRILLPWDGLATQGNVQPVVDRAKALGIPIDVMPLKYNVSNEVLVDRFVAPTWKRENEPFSVEVFVRSTNAGKVTGTLEVKLNDQYLTLDPRGANPTRRTVTLDPGLNRFTVPVPGQSSASILRFKATFNGQELAGGLSTPGGAKGPGKLDTLSENNSGSGFTVIKGKGKILYVDNAVNDAGQSDAGRVLADALAAEGIALEVRSAAAFPRDPLDLQNFDAVILHNVPRGTGGLNDDQDKMLARYVHDMGGGLVMIGGPETFGAGGWQSSKVEEVLPVNMDIPAQRQVPKGALVLIVHSCEMARGNYWGEQCAIQAMKTLSDRDEIGVITYGWGGGGGGGVGGAQWDFPLAQKGDGNKVEAAIKQMKQGDMPDFNDAIDLAVNGTGPGAPCLANSDAKQRHIIVISDGDPQPPGKARNGKDLYRQMADLKITVSTITVYPHQLGKAGVPTTMEELAVKTKGRFYGPVESNPSQLPQIFIKEATVVRRSLISENEKGIPVKVSPATASDLIKGIRAAPSVRGLVLTSRKPNPQIDVPLVAGDNNDPLLASWQAGLGRAAVFTSDATNRWANQWVASADFSRFWAQVVRSVARPPMSTDFDIRVTQDGNKGKIVVEAMNKDAGFINFLRWDGTVYDPDLQAVPVRLVQVGPGVYEANFDAGKQGNYITNLAFTGPGQKGFVMGGVSQNSSPETRELQSNDTLLEEIAQQTGGRIIQPFDKSVNLFDRTGMQVASSPLPVWDVLIPFLLALIIVDVAVRRIAWDWTSTKRAAAAAAGWVRSHTATRTVGQKEAEQTLGSLKQVRANVADQRFKPGADPAPGQASGTAPPGPPAVPNPKAKFEAKEGVSGDISQVLGGATNKSIPAAPKTPAKPKGQQGETPGNVMGGLMAAKRRAQDKIKEKEEGQS